MKESEGEAEKSGGSGAERTGFAAHCTHCRRETIFTHVRVSNRRHLLLTVVTGGLWSLVWAALLVGKGLRPWRCSVCGWHKPECRKTARISL